MAVEVDEASVYVESKSFIDDGDPVIDIVFFCRYRSGEPTALDSDEVAGFA